MRGVEVLIVKLDHRVIGHLWGGQFGLRKGKRLVEREILDDRSIMRLKERLRCLAKVSLRLDTRRGGLGLGYLYAQV
jgi:hypothetical protein